MPENKATNKGTTHAILPPSQQKNITKIQRPMLCRVLLLNDEMFEVSVDKCSNGQLFFDNVCDYLDLIERDYFGLMFRDGQDAQSTKYWLDLTKRITRQKSGKMSFEFALKFYPPDPTQLTESMSRYLVCLQLRRDVISGKLPCSQATQAMLGSYAVQAHIGDFDPVDHGSGIDYLRKMTFAADQTDDLLVKIAELHKQHKGQSPEQAELHYLEYSKKIGLYGIDLHRAKDSEWADILLGVGAPGISVYRDNIRISRFVWPKILKISYRRNKFLLRIRPTEYETFESWIVFRLPNNKMAKRLWKISVENHAFLRLRSAEDAKKRSGFPRFGSKYRYSGRTLYQARLSASVADRSSRKFDYSQQSFNSVPSKNTARESVRGIDNFYEPVEVSTRGEKTQISTFENHDEVVSSLAALDLSKKKSNVDNEKNSRVITEYIDLPDSEQKQDKKVMSLEVAQKPGSEKPAVIVTKSSLKTITSLDSKKNEKYPHQPKKQKEKEAVQEFFM